MNLRNTTAACAALLALAAAAPAAQAKNVVVDDVFVCNTASQNWQGDQGSLVVSEADPQGALRYDQDLIPKKTNPGLINAAAHSRALALCGAGSTTSGGTGTGTGDGTGGGTGTGDPLGGGGDPFSGGGGNY